MELGDGGGLFCHKIMFYYNKEVIPQKISVIVLAGNTYIP